MTGFWVLAAVLCAVCTAVLLAPLRQFRWLSGGLMVALPLLSLALYGYGGHPDLPDQPLATRDTSLRDQRQLALNAALRLADRLKTDPQDLPGWALLGQSWLVLGHPQAAADAFERAAALASGDRQNTLKLAEIEALVTADDGEIGARARTLIAELRDRAPDLPAVRYYQGLSLWQAGEMAGARKIWQALRDQARGDEPWLPLLDRRLRETPTGQ